jgi:hypothetical protein
MYFNFYLYYLSIISIQCLSNVYGAIGIEHVRVKHVANICITRLGMMHFTLTYEMCDS